MAQIRIAVGDRQRTLADAFAVRLDLEDAVRLVAGPAWTKGQRMNFGNYDSEVRSTESQSECVQDLRDLLSRRETVDAWQHERMLSFASPIIEAYPGAHWLTIGDAGADGWILRGSGVETVTASSVSDGRLKKLKEMGYLKGIEVRALNAEHLELPDASVDLVLCRQTYHHLHRAPLAFYEFMRVSRVGFMLIEPAEFPRRPLNAVRVLAKVALRKRKPIYDSFEPHNYIYRVSERDIFRMLAAVQVPWFAIRKFNNFNSGWLARQRRDALLGRLIFQAAVGVQDALSSCRLMSPGLCVIFVPTSPAAEPAQEALRVAGFRIVPLPENPWVS
jgi:ubiquinone/menaquinone biosynthesis C-methylase UbiE